MSQPKYILIAIILAPVTWIITLNSVLASTISSNYQGIEPPPNQAQIIQGKEPPPTEKNK